MFGAKTDHGEEKTMVLMEFGGGARFATVIGKVISGCNFGHNREAAGKSPSRDQIWGGGELTDGGGLMSTKRASENTPITALFWRKLGKKKMEVS